MSFSHGMSCGELLFVSAQLPRLRRAQWYTGYRQQAQLTIDNIGRVHRLWVPISTIVKLNTWFVGRGTDEDWRRAARVAVTPSAFQGLVRRACRGITLRGGALIRQECWAMRGLDGRFLKLSWPLVTGTGNSC